MVGVSVGVGVLVGVSPWVLEGVGVVVGVGVFVGVTLLVGVGVIKTGVPLGVLQLTIQHPLLSTILIQKSSVS